MFRSRWMVAWAQRNGALAPRQIIKLNLVRLGERGLVFMTWFFLYLQTYSLIYETLPTPIIHLFNSGFNGL